MYNYYFVCVSRQCGDRPLPVWGYRDRGLDIITQSSCYSLPYTLTRLNVVFYVTRTVALSLFCMQIQLYLIVNWNNIFQKSQVPDKYLGGEQGMTVASPVSRRILI